MKHLLTLFLFVTILGCDPEPAMTTRFLNVFPNPASQGIAIFVQNESASFTLKVFNNRGQNIFERTVTGTERQFQVDIDEAGTYYVMLEGNGVKETQTVICWS